MLIAGRWWCAANLTPNPFLRTLTPGADAVPSPAKKAGEGNLVLRRHRGEGNNRFGRKYLEFGSGRGRLLETQAGVICEIAEIAVSGEQRDFVVET
jgi:hypothetical protein